MMFQVKKLKKYLCMLKKTCNIVEAIEKTIGGMGLEELAEFTTEVYPKIKQIYDNTLLRTIANVAKEAMNIYSIVNVLANTFEKKILITKTKSHNREHICIKKELRSLYRGSWIKEGQITYGYNYKQAAIRLIISEKLNVKLVTSRYVNMVGAVDIIVKGRLHDRP